MLIWMLWMKKKTIDEHFKGLYEREDVIKRRRNWIVLQVLEEESWTKFCFARIRIFLHSWKRLTRKAKTWPLKLNQWTQVCHHKLEAWEISRRTRLLDQVWENIQDYWSEEDTADNNMNDEVRKHVKLLLLLVITMLKSNMHRQQHVL